MLGFLKKKKKQDTPDQPVPQEETEQGADAVEQALPEASEKPSKKSKVKLIVFILLILAAVGAAGAAVYFLYLAPKSGGDVRAPYKKVAFTHIDLPDEMLQYSYTHYPDLYQAMLEYENEISLIDDEIGRIEAIGQQYPEQVKIADKEKKSWEKTRAGLEKAFLKIKKPVKESYVLFRVNREQGMTRIEETRTDLTASLKEALVQAQTLTEKLKQEETVPDGFIKGTIYKLKKKFL